MKISATIRNAHPDVSRQRLWQLEMKRRGLCIICADPAKTSLHCRKHADAAARAALRSYYRKRTKKLATVAR